MNITLLTSLIAAACFQPDYSFTEKQVCIEVITNCAIVGAGEVSQHYKDCFIQKPETKGN